MTEGRDKQRRDPSRRAFRLLNALIREPGLTVAQAQEFTGVVPSRTLEIMRELVDEVDCAEFAPGSPMRARLVGLRHGAASHEIAIAACFAASLAPLFEGTQLDIGVREGLRYVIDASPRPEKFDEIERKFFFVRGGGESALPRNGELLRRLAKAILDQRAVAITYTRFLAEEPEAKETYEPLSIAIYDHQLYVVGRRPSDHALRTLRFSRITAVRTLSRSFDYPTENEFSPRQLFAHAFGVFLSKPDVAVETVEIRLTSKLTGYAKSHRWHSSQTVAIDDAGVTVRIRVCVCPEVETWVLGFGEEAEVIAPASLREKIARRAEALARVYRPGDD